MLAEPPVVEPDDQPQPGVEPPGPQGRVDVGLVVVIDQRQRLGVLHPGLDERLVVGLARLHDPYGLRGRTPRSGLPPGPHRPGHPPEQRRRPPRHHRLLPAARTGFRQQYGHALAVDARELGGEPMHQSVVAADHHVWGGCGLLGLLR